MSWFIPKGDQHRTAMKKSIDAKTRKYLDREWLRNHLLYQGIVRDENMDEYSKWVDELLHYLYDANMEGAGSGTP